ncbi:uncharacterized protein VSU04_005765 isoform 2-T2 [Chlamydotis macqueenii]
MTGGEFPVSLNPCLKPGLGGFLDFDSCSTGWRRGLTALELKLGKAFGKTGDVLDEDSVDPLVWQVTTEINRELFNTEVEEKAEKRGEQLLENWKSSALKKGAGFPETEVTLGAQGVLGQTACLLRQSQTLLLKVKEECLPAPRSDRR